MQAAPLITLTDESIYDNIVEKIKDVYSSCSAIEQNELRQILVELSTSGASQTLEQLWLADFKEMPVSIDQFICNPEYLGLTNRNGEAVYPFWKQTARDIFSNGNKYYEIILSGATRIGKTSTMVLIMSYMLYRLMLYRAPHEYFKKKEVSKFTIAFANLTKELAYGVAYKEYQSTLKDSEWFCKHGSFSRSDRNYYYIPEGGKIDIIAGSSASNFLGMQIFAAAIDEANFAKSGVKDINKAKADMKSIYDTINARISGTFRINGEVYGKMITSSSKNTDSDFLSDHIEKQLSSGNTSLYLVDEPQWKILPKSMFSDKVFHFTVGDRYKRGFVIPEENDDELHRQEYLEQGFQVIEAPLELKRNFIADYDIALRDIAGISVVGAMGFITQESLTPCISQDRINPFFQDILTIGDKDELEIVDFFHDEVVPNELRYQKLNIHIDLGETQNRTGISGCCVCGTKVVETLEGKKASLPYLKQVFAVAIQAPRGGRQSFQKVIKFIIQLRQLHYNVGTISTDQFQSDFLRELLEQQGFATAKFSVGMEPYIGLKNLLIDQRIETVKCQLQEDELINTRRDSNKITHPEDSDGGHGDLADACCGSAWSLVTEQVSPQSSRASVASIMNSVNVGINTRRQPSADRFFNMPRKL